MMPSNAFAAFADCEAASFTCFSRESSALACGERPSDDHDRDERGRDNEDVLSFGRHVSSQHFYANLLDGIVRTVVGALLMLYPDAGAQSITLLLSFYFIVAGLFKTFGSIAVPFPGWGWIVASGVVSVALGVMLAMQ